MDQRLHKRICQLEDQLNQLSSRFLNASKGAVLTTDAKTAGNQHTTQVNSYGTVGEVHNDITVAGMYGFSSAHLAGATAMTNSPYGNNQNKFISHIFDVRFHPKNMKPGETQIYDNIGQKVYLSNGAVIVDCKEKILLQVGDKTIMTITGNEIDISADVKVSGTITATGDVKAGSISLESHEHLENGKGSMTAGPQ
ncbi:hypothetical protein HK22_02110 [Gluconobacter sp. DsW_056]|uniref:phage baseplate assembly protein n=1 Tax=Gluconobacter sp. DsW_056 TaxID=1511209 RepID=UPI000A3B4D24|nr:phage baseplate assembly protein [Gluconobacter sp. DsW_056]OUI81673.1 hypothetical protein HK22_02110 [Gluconobacter sp. DsW_056]